MSPFAARYDLRFRAASFDFFTWLLHVRALGATEVVFGLELTRKSSWSDAEIRARFKSIIEPGPALLGLTGRVGDDGVDTGSHRLYDLVSLLKPDFERLKSVRPPGSARYTVTLRRATLKKHRNSVEEVWRKFAKTIGAVVIEDYAVKPMHLHERMALYAGAKMNFGVTNGPIAMLFYTPYPVAMLDCVTDLDHIRGHGVGFGHQHPLALPNQKLVWDKPTMDVLMREFEAVKCCT